VTDFRQDLHEALDEPGFESTGLLKQAMARLDEPRRPGSYAWQVVVAAILVVALVATFLVVRAHRVALSPAGSSGWLAADLPGMHSGFRAAAYDAGRNCLWIITRQPPLVADGRDTVTLNRLNLADRSATPSLLSMPATGYLTGMVGLDAGGKVWMSWGRLLIEYDPDTNGVQSFRFPVESTVSRASSARIAEVHPDGGSGTDGNAVGMAIGSDNEIWVIVANVQAVYGFNPATASWDRIVRVPLDPAGPWSRLVAAGPGRLVMSGVVIVRGNGTPHLAVIDTASGRSSVMPPKVDSFGLIDDNTAVYTEPTNKLGELSLGKVNLTDGSTTTLIAKAPVNYLSTFVTDASGRVWFPFIGSWNIGIARLDPSTGATREFPFSYVKHPGTPEPVISSCPSPRGFMDRCFPQYRDPTAVPGDPEVQQLVVDKKGNVWVITAQPGARLPGQELTESAAMTPVAELVAAAAG
jgi:hypothetical protein